MTLTQFRTRLNYILRGLDDSAPTVGDQEDLYWIDTLNTVKNNLYNNIGQTWSITHKTTVPNEPGTVATTGTTTLTGTDTFFTDYQVGDTVTVSGETVRTINSITSDTVLTVSAAFDNTDSGLTFTKATIIKIGTTRYNLHRSYLAPSGRAQIMKTDGNISYIDIIKPQEASNMTRNVYIEDENPENLVFTNSITSNDGLVGGTLIVPGYYMPDDISEENDILPFTIPDWAVYQCASEIAFNDITYEDKAGDLNNKANALYQQMMSRNRRGTTDHPRITPTQTKTRLGMS